MDFGEALKALKTGQRVARSGWNGKGMFLYLVNGSTFTVNRPPLLGIYPEGTVIDYLPHIDMKTADNKCVPWLASQTDLLAEDWAISSLNEKVAGGSTREDEQDCRPVDARPQDAQSTPTADLIAHLRDQCSFSATTFGPGERLQGVSDHIRKELNEVAMASPGPERQMEWIDVVMLALDGAWRSGMGPEAIFDGLQRKLAKNKARTWPDWRTADPNKAIEHDRTKDRSE